MGVCHLLGVLQLLTAPAASLRFRSRPPRRVKGAIVVAPVGRFLATRGSRDAAPFGAVPGSGVGGADWLGRQRVPELMTRADAQLAEDLVQVVLHGAAADEQPRGDVR